MLANAHSIPLPEREYAFLPGRRYRIDFYWRGVTLAPTMDIGDLAVEVEGGTASGRSRHTKAAGFENDCAKYNELALCGIMLLRFTADMVRSGFALRQIMRAFGLPM